MFWPHSWTLCKSNQIIFEWTQKCQYYSRSFLDLCFFSVFRKWRGKTRGGRRKRKGGPGALPTLSVARIPAHRESPSSSKDMRAIWRYVDGHTCNHLVSCGPLSYFWPCCSVVCCFFVVLHHMAGSHDLSDAILCTNSSLSENCVRSQTLRRPMNGNRS